MPAGSVLPRLLDRLDNICPGTVIPGDVHRYDNPLALQACAQISAMPRELEIMANLLPAGNG